MAPGSRLLAFASRWFDERTVARVFEPLLADYQREWADATSPRRRLVTVRAGVAFIASAIALSPRAFLLEQTPPSITRRVIARMIVFCSVVCGLMMIPFFTELGEMPLDRLAWLLIWLAPSMLLVAFPFAIGFVVDGVRRHAQPTPAERIVMLRASLVVVVLMIALHGWIVPASNQRFRIEVLPGPPPARGVRELTTPQLFETPWLARAEGIRRAEAVQREVHNRAAFAALPLVLVWMRWRALSYPSSRWRLPAWLAAAATIIAYFGLRSNDAAIERALGLAIGAGAWVPLVVFVIAGLTRDHFATPVGWIWHDRRRRPS